ncbi:MAG TPA: cupin domain-containing protein [Solirubrobacteraceae bacterium]|nr:cupin domain-containing protein [Solirubrobacteraceae bacterium]
MAQDVVFNEATGERVAFLSETPELLVMQAEWTRPGRRAAEHVHPEMEERWTVLEGRAAFRIGGGAEVEAGPGETVVAPTGVRHVAWNPTEEPVRLRIEMRPALRWRAFVERLFAAGGRPDPELLREFAREVAPP